MMSDRELFKAALADGICERYESELAQLNGSALVISPEHIKAINKITSREADRSKWKKAIAAILIAALLALVGCAVAFREEIFGFIMQLEDGYFSFRVDGAEQTDFVPCYLAYVPEGYELDRETDIDGYVSYLWKDGKGNTLSFINYSAYASESTMDSTEGMSNYLSVSGYDIYVRDYDSSHIYLFTNGKDIFKIKSTLSFDKKELTKIIEGITPKN